MELPGLQNLKMERIKKTLIRIRNQGLVFRGTKKSFLLIYLYA